MEKRKRLHRSTTNRVIAGVCGGLAEYFNIDPTIVRIVAVLGLLITGSTFWVYVILAIVMPKAPPG
jgi:phage shock protein C